MMITITTIILAVVGILAVGLPVTAKVKSNRRPTFRSSHNSQFLNHARGNNGNGKFYGYSEYRR